MRIQFEVNEEQVQNLRNLQAILGCTDLRGTANLLMGLGELVVNEALKGGRVGIVNENENAWRPLSDPALDHIKQIIAEDKPD